jgi:hypothetical protein
MGAEPLFLDSLAYLDRIPCFRLGESLGRVLVAEICAVLTG